MLKLDAYFDRVITFRPPAHCVRHPCKVAWFIHHVRVFYDLWDTPYRPFPDGPKYRALRAAVMQADTGALAEAHRLFTNSAVVGKRLMRFNGLASEVLYPPVLRPELFRAEDYGDEIVCVCRVEHHKRQHMLVEAMRHVRTPVRLRLCGLSLDAPYSNALRAIVERDGTGDRVVLEERWISEEEKADRFAGALAVAYVPLDEDSYGYPTVEAAHAARATVTLDDSGGTAEFVIDHVNGRIATPDARALAAVFDELYADRAAAKRMGLAARERVSALGISWNTVLGRLLE
ncbi:MAG: glycosyltransferase family 4 protein, partial [Acidisphaera sp.]|nr:glycosyltransferase family 4 protein [Acidisphaera sp.]